MRYSSILEWLKSKSLATPNADEEFSLRRVGMKTQAVTLEDSPMGSYRAKHNPNI